MKIACIRNRLLWKLLLRLQYSIKSIGTSVVVWKRISVLLYEKGEGMGMGMGRGKRKRKGKGLPGFDSRLISWLTLNDLWFSIPLGHVI